MRPHDDGIDDAEIYELLRPHRPDPERFAAGVAARLAEPDAGRGADRGAAPRSRAASWLPFDPTGGAWLASTFSGVLAIPVLLLGASVAAFGAGVRAIGSARRGAAGSAGPAARKRDARPYWMSLLPVGALVVAASPAVFGQWAIDVVVAIVTASMFGLVAVIRRSARIGLHSRGAMARFGAELLAALFGACFLWTQAMGQVYAESAVGVGAAAGVCLFGAGLLGLVAWREGSVRWFGGVWGVGWFALIVLMNPFGVTRATPAALREFVATFDGAPTQLRGWEALSHAFEALAAVDAPTPAPERLRAALRAAIAAGDDVHPTVWTTAAVAGALEVADWRQVVAPRLMTYRLDQWLARKGPLHQSNYAEFELVALLATREPTAAEREWLAARIVQSWPQVDEPGALGRAVACVRWLELLGRADLVAERRAAAHEILVRGQISRAEVGLFVIAGGFTDFPASIRMSLPGPTWHAVDLMARVGVPEGVDLPLLRDYLRRESRAFPLFVDWMPELRTTARAALLRLEREIGLPGRTFLAAVLAERLLIATSLIVALCLLAVTRWCVTPMFRFTNSPR